MHEVCGGAELLVLPEGPDLDDPVDDGVHDHRRHQHDRQDDQDPHSELQLCKRRGRVRGRKRGGQKTGLCERR